MRNKRLVVTLGLIVVLGVGLGLSRQQSTGQSKDQSAQHKPAEVPDHVVYRHLFHHLVALKKKAEDAEKNGEDATQYRTHFKRKAELSDYQASILDDTAAEYDQQEKLLEARAKPLLDAYKAQYPDGKVPHGQRPAPPPAELRALSEERDALVLRMKERLRTVFGEGEFNRFDNFVKTRVAPNVQQLSPK
jgi:hypothetical protein